MSRRAGWVAPLFLASVAVATCPDPDQVRDHLGGIEMAKKHFAFDTLPGKDAPLLPGLRLDLTSDPLAGGWTAEFDSMLLPCISDDSGVTEHELDMQTGVGSVLIRIKVSQVSSAEAQEYAIHAAGINQLGARCCVLGFDIGDWSLVPRDDDATPSVTFVRNNVVVKLNGPYEAPITQADLEGLARRLDAQLLAQPEFSDLEASGRLPVVTDFRLDLPDGVQPQVGVEVPIALEASDPFDEELTFRMIVEKPGRAWDVGAINRTEDVPPRYTFRPRLAGQQVIHLFVMNESGLLRRTQLPTDVARREGSPVAVARRDAETVECSMNGVGIPLDATGSFDPDGEIVRYAWSGSRQAEEPNAPVTTMRLGVEGTYTVSLTVVDDRRRTDRDSYRVRVVDTLPPVPTAVLEPAKPWPPASAGVPSGTYCTAAPSRRPFFVRCGATDICDVAMEVSAKLLVYHHDVPVRGGECVPRVDEVPVDCDQRVEVELLASRVRSVRRAARGSRRR